MTNPVEHAKAYPFFIPDQSYVLDAEGWHALDETAFDRDGRHGVIASGSNASPERLLAKFADHPELLETPIYVTRARLSPFDTVYSAHITSYGSIPATLAHAPDCEIDVFVTWLTDDQLQRMHDTEALGINYDYVRLDGITLALDGGETLDQAFAYLSRWGCLNRGEKPIALADTQASGRTWQTMTQAEVLDYVQSLFKSEQDPHTFVQKQIESEVTRQGRIVRLSLSALEHGWEQVKILSETDEEETGEA